MLSIKRPMCRKVISVRSGSFDPKICLARRIPGKVTSLMKKGAGFLVTTHLGPCDLYESFARDLEYVPQLYDIIQTDVFQQGKARFCRKASLKFRDGRTEEQRQAGAAALERIERISSLKEKTDELFLAIEKFPDDMYLLSKLISELLDKHRSMPQSATPLVEKLILISPVDMEVWILAAKHALRLNDHKKAKTCAYFLQQFYSQKCIAQQIAIHPHPYALYVYGEIDRHDKNYRGARANYLKCLHFKPDEVPALIGLMLIAQAEHDHVSARRYRRQILKVREQKALG